MIYTAIDALKLAAELEPILSAQGYHVAIGGSCVYRGYSEKDMDILIYPHGKQTSMERADIDKIKTILACLGFLPRIDPNSPNAGESSGLAGVTVTDDAKGRRVDFFIMTRVANLEGI